MRLPPRLAAAAALATPAAAAQPACAAGTLESYIALGATGCTIGAARVGSFAIAQFVGYAGQVTLTPYSRAEGPGTVVGLTMAFDAPLTRSFTCSGPVTFNPTGVAANILFGIDVGPGSLIGGVRVDELFGSAIRSAGPADPQTIARYSGSAAVEGGSQQQGFFGAAATASVVDGCPDAVPLVCLPTAAQPVQQIPQQVGTGRLGGFVSVSSGRPSFATPVNHTATLSAVRGGVYFAPAASVVPEPSTFVLGAVGGLALAGVGAARRRRRAQT